MPQHAAAQKLKSQKGRGESTFQRVLEGHDEINPAL